MGHVFVVPGDLIRFACDARLLPTDRLLTITPAWRTPDVEARVAALDPGLRRRFGAEEILATPLPDGDGPRPVLTAVPFTGVGCGDDVRRPLTEGLTAAARVAGPSRRAVPLIAMPLFGSSGGGGDPLRGELIRIALDVGREVASGHGVDVALVLREPADLAQAQEYRRRDPGRWWPELDDRLRATLRTVAGYARRGLLVPFIGAGVSISAGLPTWADLLATLARDRLPAGSEREFAALPVLDQAEILQGLHTDRAAFTTEIAKRTRADRYGLAPALLAGLPTGEAVTLNYDELYEMASADAGRRTAVLPFDAADSGDRWLLKLHGSVSRPDSIVLTRRDYLGYRNGREALSALAKALLLTRHLLFVGFGLSDDHFHEVMHDVRAVAGGHRRTLGTALVLEPSTLRDTLWRSDLDFVPVGGDDVAEQARRQEIALDHLLADTDRGLGHVLDPRFRDLLPDAERRLADRLTALASAMDADETATATGDAVRELLTRLGKR
ncbi:SIR2 family protein [Pseudonocardia spirodelae]|uniref:SIR2 family protein n=1 Tax=Pseudonocardia spirodelae TaxID=3133431 RepID=A0ABU8T634_9PSEU